MQQRDRTCGCCTKHIPKPLIYIKFYLSDTVSMILCPTAYNNVDRLLHLYWYYKGTPPWRLLKQYSEFTRQIVERTRDLEQRNRRVEAGADSIDIDPTGYPEITSSPVVSHSAPVGA